MRQQILENGRDSKSFWEEEVWKASRLLASAPLRGTMTSGSYLALPDFGLDEGPPRNTKSNVEFSAV